MESKAKLLGHPIHPMLIVFPLGLLATAVIFDIFSLILGSTDLWSVSYYMMGAGILGAMAAALFGTIDFIAIPEKTRAKRIGLFHGLGNVFVTALFAGSFAIRYGASDHVPTFLGLILSFGGAALSGLTAWLGGELVSRLGVGVEPDANLNAPNSLSSDARVRHSLGATDSRPG